MEKNKRITAGIRALLWWVTSCSMAGTAWLVVNATTFEQLLMASITGLVGVTVCSVIAARRAPTLSELAQALIVLFLLGCSTVDGLPVWSVPKDLAQVFSLSKVAVSTIVLSYFLVAIGSLRTRHRGPSWVEATAILGCPYLFSWLLLLVAPSLPGELLRLVQLLPVNSFVADWLARGLVVLVFNLVVVLLLGGIVGRRLLVDFRLCFVLALSALFVGATPQIADFGSVAGSFIGNYGPGAFSQLAAVIVCLVSVVIAQAGLWAQTYLITGLLMDALQGRQPNYFLGREHLQQGLIRGAMYSLVFMSVVQAASACGGLLSNSSLPGNYPIALGLIVGALVFPLVKTIAESFDGSAPFLTRLVHNHGDGLNYLRGAVVGCGLSWAIICNLSITNPWLRSLWGFTIGAVAYAGVHMVRDLCEIAANHRRSVQRLNVYFIEGLLGGVVGAALGWYAESSQVEVILAKLSRYTAIHLGNPEQHIIYPLFSKWGALDLGGVTGGARLLFNESVSGIISWSLAAPLFSLNLVLLTALLRRETGPLRDLFTSHGLAKVVQEALRVERWGLWMAPIIYSFLRMSPEPTWYNQDGALRTLSALGMSIWQEPTEFRVWSLWVFTSMLAYDWLRILIWFDHMGFRVATLVNLSFIGGDLLDEKAARAMGHSAPARCIPEGIRRFGTWMPLLIPFYIPRGADWDTAWNSAEKIALGVVATAYSSSAWICGLFVLGGSIAAIVSLFQDRSARSSRGSWADQVFTLGNETYTILLDAKGRGWSRVLRSLASHDAIDLSRRPDCQSDPSSKSFYLVEEPAGLQERADLGSGSVVWSTFESPRAVSGAVYSCNFVENKSVHYVTELGSLRVETDVRVDLIDPVEIWTLRLFNQGSSERKLRLHSYRDLVLQATGSAERHPSYNDIHVAVSFLPQLQGVFAANRLLLDKNRRPSSEVFFHAVGPLPEGAELVGYEDARTGVIGLGSESCPLGVLGNPRSVHDQGTLYPFEPIASLCLQLTLRPGEGLELRFADGWARDRNLAAELLERHLGLPLVHEQELQKTFEHPRQLKQYLTRNKSERPWGFSADGKELHVERGTPRIWAHPMCNPHGYGCFANNEGTAFSFNANAQQNSLTPFRLGNTSSERPGQAWYIWNTESSEPLLCLPTRLGADIEASDHGLPDLRTVFGQGYVSHTAKTHSLESALTLTVLPDQPVELRMLRLKNTGVRVLNLRVALAMELVLAEIPADSLGSLEVEWDENANAVLASNPRQQFKRGYFFVAPCFKPESTALNQSSFVGLGRTMANPILAEKGFPDMEAVDNGYQVAAFSTLVNLHPGEEYKLDVVMGQVEKKEDVYRILGEFRSPSAREESFSATKRWWNDFLGVLRVETDDPEFDRLVNYWLPYQLVTARLWGRTGPHQRSGAYGFRDQLQDVIGLAAIHPQYCRDQILLHAGQQFREGDTMQWWHRTWEGKTGLGARNRASDVMLWLPYVVLHYLDVTGDMGVLEEEVCFLEGRPIPPKSEGLCFAPRVSKEKATVYEHCRLAVDWVIGHRGKNGLPLMGSGDWNDGLDNVGRHGTGESIWLGFFCYRVLRDFIPLVEKREGREEVARLSKVISELSVALSSMHKQGRFIRCITDDGEELMYDDALTSSWPAMSEAVEETLAAEVLEHGIRCLERESFVCLLSPPFTAESHPYPGRIAVYPPGVRENGGQYSHGSSWLIDGALSLAERADARGDSQSADKWRETARRLWYKISPLTQTSEGNWQRYGLEPHQQPADVYCGPGYEGRGGWSWYTGSAGRMLVSAWALLGLEFRQGSLQIARWSKDGHGLPKLKKVEYRGQEIFRKE